MHDSNPHDNAPLSDNPPLYKTDFSLQLEAIDRLLVSQILSESAQQQFAKGKIARSELAPFAERIKEISQEYTTGSDKEIDSIQKAQAYALYYLPINILKTLSLLRLALPHLSERQELDLLDFGCGPGTGTLAAYLTIPERTLNVTAIDTSPFMREVYQQLTSAFQAHSTHSLNAPLLKETASRLPKASQDIIFALNVFNELSESEAPKLLSLLTESLRDRGILFLIEPALKSSTRALMHYRDLLVSQHQFAPLYPCTHSHACPMLKEDESDWCHGEIDGPNSQIVRQLDEVTEFNKHRIKFSAFIARKGPPISVNGYRVVQSAEKTREGNIIQLCGDDFYGQLKISKKKNKEIFRASKRARLHDRISGIATNDLTESNAPRLITDLRKPPVETEER